MLTAMTEEDWTIVLRVFAASRSRPQTLQAYRTSMREDGAELRLVRRACARLNLDQIRPHGLVLAIQQLQLG